MKSKERPIVGVFMGSRSDLSTMEGAILVLREFKIPHAVHIVSAHRTPTTMLEVARIAFENGLRVIIAGAGGAAHLPGMLASVTALPVIGVPVAIGQLQGLDALLSIAQMPRGVPVATVAIGNSSNAAYLALRILATSRPELYKKLEAHRLRVENKVLRDSLNQSLRRNLRRVLKNSPIRAAAKRKPG